MPRPNVLFLMSDQHNAKCLGCSGHPVVETPQLDQLAARGTRFTSAFVQNPICTPSRMCWLTSQYAHNHGYYGLSGPCPHQLPSLFQQFHDAGWFTGAIGKVHLPDGWIDPHCDFLTEWSRPNRAGVPPYDIWLRGRSGIPPHNEQHPDGRPDPLGKELDFDTGWAPEMTHEFLRRRGDQPFLLWYTMGKPHQEYSPAQEFWDLYPDPPMPPSADDGPGDRLRPFRRAVTGQREHPPARYEPSDYASLRSRKLRGYYGNISQVDDAVGQVLAMLDRQGLREDTIVVYSSDHGDFACEHGLLEKAPGIASDAIGRVPLIWSWPGHLPAGAVREQLVESLDLWPTLAALCGLPALSMWDGHDLTAILRDDGPDVREAAFTENPWTKVIATQRYRMAWVPKSMYPDDPVRGELYDRLDDPWERHNLYARPAYEPVVRELTERLTDWLVTSQHPVTAWPIPPHPSMDERWAQELPGDQPLPEDGRTAPAQVRRAVEAGRDNYL